MAVHIRHLSIRIDGKTVIKVCDVRTDKHGELIKTPFSPFGYGTLRIIQTPIFIGFRGEITV